ncbi:hypothetical protein AVEN_153060-1 [Araneus ventricosus]|uniref:Uncharacterized protein n=1 Tax=Araneus ventricosus TaxID=182803 RepID=A0A4Y2V5Z8_ARAVE|nr:hypothetical protein AVEN_153060-1 [Araneus ventricosus]
MKSDHMSLPPLNEETRSSHKRIAYPNRNIRIMALQLDGKRRFAEKEIFKLFAEQKIKKSKKCEVGKVAKCFRVPRRWSDGPRAR